MLQLPPRHSMPPENRPSVQEVTLLRARWSPPDATMPPARRDREDVRDATRVEAHHRGRAREGGGGSRSARPHAGRRPRIRLSLCCEPDPFGEERDTTHGRKRSPFPRTDAKRSWALPAASPSSAGSGSRGAGAATSGPVRPVMGGCGDAGSGGSTATGAFHATAPDRNRQPERRESERIGRIDTVHGVHGTPSRCRSGGGGHLGPVLGQREMTLVRQPERLIRRERSRRLCIAL